MWLGLHVIITQRSLTHWLKTDNIDNMLKGGFYTMRDRRRGSAMHQTRFWVGWREINRRFYTILRGRLVPPASKWVPEPFGRTSLRDQELLHEGKDAFWQFTNGCCHGSGICHQSYQCFSMFNTSDGMWDRLWCKDIGVLTWANISLPRLASCMVWWNLYSPWAKEPSEILAQA